MTAATTRQAGENVGAWAIHAGDTITVAEPGHGSVAAIVTEIRHDKPGTEDIEYETLGSHRCDCLHCSPLDQINRLSVNGAVG